jgi:hypothetical protein
MFADAQHKKHSSFSLLLFLVTQWRRMRDEMILKFCRSVLVKSSPLYLRVSSYLFLSGNQLPVIDKIFLKSEFPSSSSFSYCDVSSHSKSEIFTFFLILLHSLLVFAFLWKLTHFFPQTSLYALFIEVRYTFSIFLHEHAQNTVADSLNI